MLRAEIRNRRLDDDTVCMGLCFDATGSPAFDAQQRAIAEYVVTRQSELLHAQMR